MKKDISWNAGMLSNEMDWKSVMSSEVFRNFVKISLDKEEEDKKNKKKEDKKKAKEDKKKKKLEKKISAMYSGADKYIGHPIDKFGCEGEKEVIGEGNPEEEEVEEEVEDEEVKLAERAYFEKVAEQKLLNEYEKELGLDNNMYYLASRGK